MEQKTVCDSLKKCMGFVAYVDFKSPVLLLNHKTEMLRSRRYNSKIIRIGKWSNTLFRCLNTGDTVVPLLICAIVAFGKLNPFLKLACL